MYQLEFLDPMYQKLRSSPKGQEAEFPDCPFSDAQDPYRVTFFDEAGIKLPDQESMAIRQLVKGVCCLRADAPYPALINTGGSEKGTITSRLMEKEKYHRRRLLVD